MHPIHVVTGAGPVGSTVALQLAGAGQRVRLLTRSGSGPEHPLVERRRVDVSRAEQLDEALAGAVAVHHCIHGSRVRRPAPGAPSSRRPSAHVLAAAGRVGAVVIFPESLYSYGPVDGPITEDPPRTRRTGKLGVRTELLASAPPRPPRRSAWPPRTSTARWCATRHAGERLVPTVLAGAPCGCWAASDQPHSFTYVPDLAAAMVRAAADPCAVGLGPARARPLPPSPSASSSRGWRQAGGVPAPRTSAIPAWALRPVGRCRGTPASWRRRRTCSPARSCSTRRGARSCLGLAPTPLGTGLKETVAWWRTVGTDG